MNKKIFKEYKYVLQEMKIKIYNIHVKYVMMNNIIK